MIDYLSSKNKNNTPIIFIHGIGSNAESFTDQIIKLEEKYFAIAINIPGYGKSKYIKNISINKIVKNKITLKTIFKGLMTFVFMDFIRLIILLIFPFLTLLLPNTIWS